MDEEDLSLYDQVFHQLLDLLRNSRLYARNIIAERGITPRQLSVLRYLHDAGPATVGQIQTFTHKSPSTTSELIAELEEMRFVIRTRSTQDNRVVHVDLTETGREKAINTPLSGLPLLRRRLRALPEDRLQEFSGMLAELMQLMEDTDTQ